MGNVSLNEKQLKFCDYYIETLNAYESAIKAGYSESYAKAQSYKMLENVGIKRRIDKRLKELEDKRIAKSEEVMKHLTAMMRGEINEEVVVTENIGDFKSKSKTIDKQVSAKERLKAAELLGKRYAMFTDNKNLDIKVPTIVFDVEDDVDEED